MHSLVCNKKLLWTRSVLSSRCTVIQIRNTDFQLFTYKRFIWPIVKRTSILIIRAYLTSSLDFLYTRVYVNQLLSRQTLRDCSSSGIMWIAEMCARSSTLVGVTIMTIKRHASVPQKPSNPLIAPDFVVLRAGIVHIPMFMEDMENKRDGDDRLDDFHRLDSSTCIQVHFFQVVIS